VVVDGGFWKVKDGVEKFEPELVLPVTPLSALFITKSSSVE
jgi:hypothetical protein